MNLHLENRATAESTRMCRLQGSGKPWGFDYEFKLAGLVALRARAAGLRFELFTNVSAARPCDDLVLRVLHPARAFYFVQLKHAEGRDKTVGLHDLKSPRTPYSISKYFEFYEEFREKHQRRYALEKDDDLLLTDCRLEDVQFLLFTNREVTYRSSSPEVSEDHSALDDLFLTGNGGRHDAFRFGASDKELWNLIEGDRRDLYQTQFLPRLKVFHRQSHATDLDALIREEIRKQFGCEVSHIDRFLERYLRFLKSWAEDDAQDYCLCESTPQLQMERLLACEFRQRARAAAGDLSFRDGACAQLRDALDRTRALRVAVRGVAPGLRAAKVAQLLDRVYADGWTYLDDATLDQNPTEALAAMCKACDVVVFDVEMAGSSDAKMKSLVKDSKKVVTLSSEAVSSTASSESQEFEDDWRLESLTQDAQDKMMEQPVLFQGSFVRLRELQGTWPRLLQECDAELLGALCTFMAILGAPMTAPDDLLCHVPRVMTHLALLDSQRLLPAMVQDSSDEDDDDPVLNKYSEHLVLDGFPDALLKRLGHGVSNRQTNDRWSILPPNEEGKVFLNICAEHPSKNVHLLQFDDKDLASECPTIVWGALRGQPDAMAPFVRLATDACVPRPICEHAGCVWTAQPLLLAGEAGVGKSYALKRAAMEARERAPAEWAVLVEVLAHRDLLHRLPEPQEIEFRHAVDLLAAAAGIAAPAPLAATARRYLEAALCDSGAVSIFVDGVDEVAPFYKDKVLRLLALLREHSKAKHIWVSCRPEVVVSLRQELRCLPTFLRPLSREEQERYLCARWGNGVPTAQVASLAAQTVSALAQTAHGNSSNSLLAAPLHLHMAAEAFTVRATEAPQSLLSASNELFVLFNLYCLFVERKRDLYMERHGLKSANLPNIIFKDDFFSLHQKCAVPLLFPRIKSTKLYQQEFEGSDMTSTDSLRREKTGILWVDEGGAPHFAHFSFAEFFGAQWLKEHRTSDDAKAILRSLYREHSSSLVLRFLELMLLQADGGAPLKGLPLHEAVLAGDDEGVARALALAEGAPPDAVDGGGRLALHLAARRGMWRAVQALLDAGCDPTHRDALLGCTSMQYVNYCHLHEWQSKEVIRTVELLLAAGGSPEELPGYFHIHLISEHDCPKLALWTVSESKKCEFSSVLHRAIGDNSVEIVRALLASGVGACDARPQGDTRGSSSEGGDDTLSKVTLGSKLKNVLRITRRKERNTKNSSRNITGRCRKGAYHQKMLREFLEYALENDRGEIAVMLLECIPDISVHDRDSKGDTLLHVAAWGMCLQAAEWLLRRGADVRARNANGEEPLCKGYHEFSQMKDKKCSDFVALLVSFGADPNCTDRWGNRPLHWAAKEGMRLTVAQLLTDRYLSAPTESCMSDFFAAIADEDKEDSVGGSIDSFVLANAEDASSLVEADANARDREGRTALHLANDEETMELLLAHGGDPHLPDNKGRTALHAAAAKEGDTKWEIVKLLLEHDARVDAADKQGKRPLHHARTAQAVNVLLQGPSRAEDVNARDKLGNTPLLTAVMMDFVEVVEELLELGADPGAADDCGLTPLHHAASQRNLPLVRILLMNEAPMDARDELGRTPLHLAAKTLNESVIRCLLQHGADATAMDNKMLAVVNYLTLGPGWLTSPERVSFITAMLLESTGTGPPNLLVGGRRGDTVKLVPPERECN